MKKIKNLLVLFALIALILTILGCKAETGAITCTNPSGSEGQFMCNDGVISQCTGSGWLDDWSYCGWAGYTTECKTSVVVTASSEDDAQDKLCEKMAVSQFECSDSDQGEDYTEKGITSGTYASGSAFTKNDYCVDNQYLKEYYCLPESVGSVTVRCSSIDSNMVCEDGICKAPFGDPCEGMDCNDNDENTIDSCNNGVCQNTPISSCSTDSDCEAEEKCEEGKCKSQEDESKDNSLVIYVFAGIMGIIIIAFLIYYLTKKKRSRKKSSGNSRKKSYNPFKVT